MVATAGGSARIAGGVPGGVLATGRAAARRPDGPGAGGG